jgi:hypothetical protein
MKSISGRPKAKNPRELMAFRFRGEYAVLLRKLSLKKNISQVRILEMALDLSAKEISA